MIPTTSSSQSRILNSKRSKLTITSSNNNEPELTTTTTTNKNPYSKLPIRTKQPLITDRYGITSPYAYEPDTTQILDQCAKAANVRLEDLSLPSVVTLMLSNSTATTTTTTNTYHHHPHGTNKPHPLYSDIHEFEPNGESEWSVMLQSYKSFLGDAVTKGLENLPNLQQPANNNAITEQQPGGGGGDNNSDDDFIWPESHIQAGIKIIATVRVPPTDFYVVFSKRATTKEKERFHETRKNTGKPKMWIELKSHNLINKVFGIQAVRIWIPKLARYRLVREPLLVSLEGDVVTVKGVIDELEEKDVPLEWRNAPRALKEKLKAATTANNNSSSMIPSTTITTTTNNNNNTNPPTQQPSLPLQNHPHR
jgi:hypothetical protein